MGMPRVIILKDVLSRMSRYFIEITEKKIR